MRSTTSIKAGLIVILGFAATGANMAQAQLEALPMGCFAAQYSAAHLAAHPDQGVAALHVWIGHIPEISATSVFFDIQAVMADQGQARRDGVPGRTLFEGGECRAERLTCANDGDGGWFTITAVEDTEITIETTGMRLVGENYDDGGQDNTGEVSSLNELGGHPTSYRLTAVAAIDCEDR